MKISIKFDPGDMWIGVYWVRLYPGLVIYVCILPMLPIRIRIGSHK